MISSALGLGAAIVALIVALAFGVWDRVTPLLRRRRKDPVQRELERAFDDETDPGLGDDDDTDPDTDSGSTTGAPPPVPTRRRRVRVVARDRR